MQGSYQEEIGQWRQQMDAALRAENGWLSLAGLFWLQPGRMTIGADPASDIVLPAGEQQIGWIDLEGDQAHLFILPGVDARLRDMPLTDRVLHADTEPLPDRVQIGRLSLELLLRDRGRQPTFAGRRWYEVREELRIPATFEAASPPRLIQITNILGDSLL